MTRNSGYMMNIIFAPKTCSIEHIPESVYLIDTKFCLSAHQIIDKYGGGGLCGAYTFNIFSGQWVLIRIATQNKEAFFQ